MGVNYAVVGIVDQPTLSQTMVDAFRALWLRPYGFPLGVRVDPAGSYDAAFRTFMEKHGVHVIPAEAHWRIGLVERRSSVLRDTLERVDRGLTMW